MGQNDNVIAITSPTFVYDVKFVDSSTDIPGGLGRIWRNDPYKITRIEAVDIWHAVEKFYAQGGRGRIIDVMAARNEAIDSDGAADILAHIERQKRLDAEWRKLNPLPDEFKDKP